MLLVLLTIHAPCRGRERLRLVKSIPCLSDGAGREDAMALLGFLRSWDEKEGEPVLKDHSTILAYLEDLIRIRSQVQFWISRDNLVPIAGKIDLLSEEAGTITIALQRALPGNLEPNTLMDMVFTLEGMRFDAPVKFVRRDGYLRAVFLLSQKSKPLMWLFPL